MANEDPSDTEKSFDCPVFVAESRHGWPRTCNNAKCKNMTVLRRHLTERPGRGYTAQLPFLELCPTCNEDFLDRDVFETRHGYRGQHCNTRQPQRKGAKAKVQWELLYRQVEAALAVQHLSTRKQTRHSVDLSRTNKTIQEHSNAAPTPQPVPTPQADPTPRPLPAPQLAPTLLRIGPHDPIEYHGPDIADQQQEQILPYVTPYQLIVDSDSDKADTPRDTDHVSSQSTEIHSCLTDVASRHQCPPWMGQYIHHQATFFLPRRARVRSGKDLWRLIPSLLHGPLTDRRFRLRTIPTGPIPDQ